MFVHKYPKLTLFFLGVIPCLLFALFTDHAWEDWYITYRAGKNLALGNGLVFEPGQVLHTFTSPINALLPAALSWLLGNNNDVAVLWLYRIVSASCLGATVLLLDRLGKHENMNRPALWFMIALFVIDGKIMDFSINGQEAAFLVLFLALTLNALLEKNTLLLGIGWAGLMWSRPDSFIYIAITAVAYLLSCLLNDRRCLEPLLSLFLRAAGITALLYGPWLIWTSLYYGSPIPHTIVAKGLGLHHSLPDLLMALLKFPWHALFNTTATPFLFMPSYYLLGGWPQWMIVLAQMLAWIAAMSWLLPKISPLTRSCSLGVLIGLFYLTHIAFFPFPWYFPLVMLLAIITLSGVLQAALLHCSKKPVLQQILQGAAAITLAVWLSATLMTGWQMHLRQDLIENSNRKQIGLWLQDHATSKHDTVFLECVGYIGFYSNLKMYDYPGMTSPEVVATRRQFGENWATLIRYLQPDWLVLRQQEAQRLYARDPELLTKKYEAVMMFDQSKTLEQYWFLPGRGYLKYDQTFIIFHRQALTN